MDIPDTQLTSRTAFTGMLVTIAVVTSMLAYMFEQTSNPLDELRDAESGYTEHDRQLDEERVATNTPIELIDEENKESEGIESESAEHPTPPIHVAPEQRPEVVSQPISDVQHPSKVILPESSTSNDPTPVASETTAPTASVSLTPAAAPRVLSANQCDSYRNSFALYPDPRVQAIRIERDLRGSDPETAALLRHIACVPQPTWIVGGDVSRIRGEVEERMQGAAASSKTPVFVIYTSPNWGDASWHASITNGSYHDLIEEIAKGIGHYAAWVVLEPDALSISSQYSDHTYQERMAEFRHSIALFKEHAPNTRVYIDAGHSQWVALPRKAELLRDAGIAEAHGFSLNISNFQTTESNITYGRQLSDMVGGKPFIIDTSRNGIGPASDNEWCNAPGRGLGQHPDLSTGIPRVDGLLWIKPPGESDGFCNGGPQAGKFWMDYALGLVRNMPQ